MLTSASAGDSSRSSPIALLAKLFGKSPSSAAPELYLGAFGKHPGWNDHIDDLGLETQRLVDLKTFMYVEGISACVDAGRWDKLDPDSQIDGFGHVILLRIRGDIIIARLWSSSDGKGRTKYPMVVAAQCNGVSLDWALNKILPELESIQERCQNAKTAAEVVAIIDSSRATLRAALTPGAASTPELTISDSFLDGLTAHPQLGPNAQGLHRILYQLSREAGDYVIGAKPASRAGNAEQAATHLRVPELTTDPTARAGVKEDLLAYSKLLLSKIEPWAPMLLVAPLSRPFIDIFIGEPSGPQLYCLRAAEKAIPLSTEIPYTLDVQFFSDVAAWLAARRGMGEVSIMPSPPSVLKKSAGSAGRFRAPVDLWSILLLVGTAISASHVMCSSAFAQSAEPAAAAQPAAPPTDRPAFEEPRRRYNEVLRQLAADLATADDAKARALIDAFAVSVQTLPGGISYLAEVESTLARLRAALDGSAAAPAPDSALKLGPAATGQYTAQRDGELIRFVPTTGVQLPELVFAPVHVPGRDALTYMSVTECSVLVASRIASLAPAGELSRAITVFDAMSDPRRGPRSWEWNKSRDAITTARAWLPSGAGGRGVPSDDSPMQYVSPAAAAYLANLVSCRLPTAVEWSSALARTHNDETSPCNLRDRAFDSFAQQVHLAPVDLDVCVPGAAPATPAADPTATPRPTDDVVWFLPVNKGCGTPFKNLVGNVAEYVLDPAANAPATPPSTTNRFQAVDDWVRAAGNSVCVIGSSALSDPTSTLLTTRHPVDLVLAGEGYSDVGFRLAFTVRADAGTVAAPGSGGAGTSNTGASAAERARRAITPLPLLQVR